MRRGRATSTSSAPPAARNSASTPTATSCAWRRAAAPSDPRTRHVMSSLAAEIATAAALFAGTNVDDVVVLSLLTASSRAGGRPRRWEIWVGQYAGFAVLVGLSAAGRPGAGRGAGRRASRVGP